MAIYTAAILLLGDEEDAFELHSQAMRVTRRTSFTLFSTILCRKKQRASYEVFEENEALAKTEHEEEVQNVDDIEIIEEIIEEVDFEENEDVVEIDLKKNEEETMTSVTEVIT